MEKCFICRIGVKKETRRKQYSNLLENQISVIFILQKLLDIPSSVCADVISSSGNPSTWLCCCDDCESFIKEAQQFLSKTVYFQKKFDLAKLQLMNYIKASHEDRKLSKEKYIKSKARVHVADYFLSLFFEDYCDASKMPFPFDEPSFPVKVEEEEYKFTNQDEDEAASDMLLNELTNDCSTEVPNANLTENDTGSSDDDMSDPLESKDDDWLLNENQDSDSEIDSIEQEHPVEEEHNQLLDDLPSLKDTVAKFKCTHCDKIYRHSISLKHHVRREHTKETPYSCELCDEKFVGRKYVYRHFEKVHPGKKPTPMIKINPNAKRKTPQRFRCSFCNCRFISKSSKEMHVKQKHPRETPYPCELCEEKFPTRKHVFRHFTKAHPGNKPTLIKPGTKAKPEKLKKPVNPEFVCRLCGRDCKMKSTFDTHMGYHNKEKNIVCELCSERFYNVTLLSWHNRSVHYEELNLEPFKCPECGKMLCDPKGLKLHIISQHTKAFEHICKECGAGYADKHKLEYHLRMKHNGEKPFECPICFEKLGSQRRVDEHIQIHTGKYRHVCNFCEKGFTSAAYLRRHMQYHSTFPHKRRSRLTSKVKNTATTSEEQPENKDFTILRQQRLKVGLRSYPPTRKSRKDTSLPAYEPPENIVHIQH